jgi:predicted permease
MVKLVTLDLGFDRSNVLLMNANVYVANVPPQERHAVYDEMEERLRSIPGVVSVGRSVRTPISHYEWSQAIVVDLPNAPRGDDAEAYFNFISPGYFPTLRIPLVAGRNFETTDTKTSAKVAIVNETLARKFFPGIPAVGRTFRVLDGRAGDKGVPVQIIGLVKDSKYESVQESMLPQAFFPASQIPEADNAEFFEVRAGSRPSAVAPLAQAAIAQVNKGVALEFHSLSEQVDDSLVQERLLATLSSFFGALALLLAMIGLYGAISYTVTQRRSEFGLRMALGAIPASILRLVMRDVVIMLCGGAIAGVAISLLAVRLVQKLIFGASAYDPLVIAGAIMLLAIVALLAGYLPARRAMRVDPMVALRYE